MIPKSVEKWIDDKGKDFFKNIGMEKDQFILDFGCGHGTYTLPASLVVGKKGKIYAVDKDKKSLDELRGKARQKNIKNIVIIKINDNIKLPLNNESMDMVLLYDVLHLVERRKVLLTEIRRVLKSDGVLSVYPKHHQTHMNMELEDVKEEIESFGFYFGEKFLKSLMHDDQLETGYVFNFRKA